MRIFFVVISILALVIGCSVEETTQPEATPAIDVTGPGADGSPGVGQNFLFQTIAPVTVSVVSKKGGEYSLYDEGDKRIASFAIEPSSEKQISASVAMTNKGLYLQRPGGDRLYGELKNHHIHFEDNGVSGVAKATYQDFQSASSDSTSYFGYNYFPGQDQFGTLIFEDLWPYLGDYDFNDLVVDYNIREAVDLYGYVQHITIQLRVVGTLASMHNGFGFQLGVSPLRVASVDGAKYTRGYTELEDNGTESRQEKAVIIAFEDAKAHHNPDDVSLSELITIEIEFTSGVHRNDLGFPPYNPFLLSNGERGREVHMPGYMPTSLINLPYFDMHDDTTNLVEGRTYLDTNDLPWAVTLPETFYYPADDTRVDTAYLKFLDWVESKGTENSDWYSNKPDYRNDPLIHRKKGTAGYKNCTDPFDQHKMLARYDSSVNMSILDERDRNSGDEAFTGHVMTWKDLSGNGYDAIATADDGQPAFSKDSGTSELQKDSYVRGSENDAMIVDIPDINADFTFILVLTPDHADPEDYDSFFSNSLNPNLDGSWQVGVRANESACPGTGGAPVFAVFLTDGNRKTAVCGGAYEAVRNVISIHYTAETKMMTFSRNGTVDGRYQWDQVPTFRLLKLFLNRASSRYFDGKIHELVLITSEVSDEQNTDIGDYLSCKWQVDL